MEVKAFKNVKNQIGYCAIWCGSCVVGNGTLKELTKRYEYIVRSYGVDKWGAEDQGFDGRELMNALKAIQNIPVCRGCLKGGGATNCKIRTCALSKKLVDCTECKEFMICKNREALHKVRTGAVNASMLVKTDKGTIDRQQLIKKWTSEIINRFPSCIVLCAHNTRSFNHKI